MTTVVGTNATVTSLTKFELKLIDYMSRRIDQWIEDIRKTKVIDQNCRDWNSQRWSGQEAVFETWTSMIELILQFDPDKGAVNSRPLIVQQAYRCLKSTQIQQLLSGTFGTQAGSKLWGRLNFIARPLVDSQ